jgi:hypothetical protein
MRPLGDCVLMPFFASVFLANRRIDKKDWEKMTGRVSIGTRAASQKAREKQVRHRQDVMGQSSAEHMHTYAHIFVVIPGGLTLPHLTSTHGCAMGRVCGEEALQCHSHARHEKEERGDGQQKKYGADQRGQAVRDSFSPKAQGHSVS